MTVNTDKRHFEELDTAKGLAIIGVVLIHTSSLYLSRFPNENLAFLREAARFSIPLFFLVSGFLYRNSSERRRKKAGFYLSYIVRRFNRILVPYFSFSLLYMAIRLAIEQTPYFKSFVPMRFNSLNDVLSAIVLVKGNPAGQLYFLPLLFLTILLFIGLEKLIRNVKVLVLLSLVISGISYLVWGDVYLSLNPLKSIGFYALGYFIYELSFEETRPLAIYCSLALVLSCLGFSLMFNSQFSVLSARMLLIYCFHILSGLCIFFGSSILGRMPTRIPKLPLVFLGVYSFQIYLLHEPYIVTVFFKVLVKLSVSNVFINQMILIVSGIVIPIFLSHYFLDRAKIFRRYFFGLVASA